MDQAHGGAVQGGAGNRLTLPALLNRLGQVRRAFVQGRIAFPVDLIPFDFRPVSRRKALNWLLTESSVIFKPARPWGFPTLVHLEPTAHCNLSCVTCPVTKGLSRPAGNMSLELFKNIVDQLADYLLLILLWDWGEPFLNPAIYEMIDYARRRRIKLVSSTNGHVFATGDHARRVVESGLDALIFSVDGLTQETYQKYRSGGELETVLKGVRRVAAEKLRQGSRTPLLNFRFIVMKHNEPELPLLEPFARALGVDLLTFRKFFAVVDPSKGSGRETGFDPAGHGHQRFQRRPSSSGLIRLDRNPCKNLWNCPAIHWDGKVCTCTCDYNESVPLGDLTKQSFREVWFGPAARRIRRTFRRSWEELPLCRDCVYAFKGGDMGRESVSQGVTFN